ncbi:MAG: acetyl-CoA carboxylase carboxyltransferase subunit alpha [bacterium]|nr:acetyl-CoA carboxylase carboxyltransferase subunit alpha [bacterium]
MSKRIYLDFEQPIADLEAKIEEMKTQAEAENQDMTEALNTLNEKKRTLEQQTYANLTSWQKYQLARHPQRPYTLDYIHLMLSDFTELHGDRYFRDDPAMVGGLGGFNNTGMMVIGLQKGRNTKENLHRNFGLAHPEGYRKALRLMKLAAKFKRPVLCLIDTPGAFPGLGSEERSVSEAIARNLMEMSRLPTPIIVAIIGEGASGGALGIGVGDRILMLENAWYSVINPEGCSLILWRSRDKKEEAARAMKITADDLLELGIIDRIVPEPFGGAHRNFEESARNLKEAIQDALQELTALSTDELIHQRVEKFCQMGVWED